MRHYRRLFDRAPDGYLATDRAGAIRDANRAAAELVDLRRKDVLGRTLASFVCDDQRSGFAGRLSRFIRRNTTAKEEWLLRLRPARREPFEAALTVAAVPHLHGNGIVLLWSLRDATRRRRMEEKLKHSERRFRSLYAEVLRQRDALRVLSARYLHAREEEAKRIAHELHDEAGQMTAAIHLALAEIEPELRPLGRERLRRIGQLIQGVEERFRCLSHELRPTILDDLGLAPALAFLCDGFASRTGLAVSVRGSTRGRLDPMVETALYRIVQEALVNVSKHARANRVEIALARGRDVITCSIRDDGVGFDDREILVRNGHGAGLGLLGIRERLDALGGSVRIHSSPREGTELLVTVPLRI